MCAEVIDIRQAKSAKPSLSTSLTQVSKAFRKEILSAHPDCAAWVSNSNAQDYAQLLCIRLSLRQHIEELFASLEGQSSVSNIFTGQIKTFDLKNFITENTWHVHQLQQDIDDVKHRFAIVDQELPILAQELLDYMIRVRKLYSVALLGVFYMLEETLSYYGPEFAKSMDKQLNLGGKATRYLMGVENQKVKFWAFRQSLDGIRDFQSQFNIVTAASFSYQLYRHILENYLWRPNNIVSLF